MPASDEFLVPFERRALEAALRQLGFLDRADELERLCGARDVALIDAFIDWYRAQLAADNTDSVKSNGQGDFTDENGMYLRLKDGRLAFYPKGPDGRVTSDEHILPDGVAATLRHALSLDDGTRLTADDLTILASAEHRTAYFDRLPDDEDMRRYGSQPVRTPAQQELAEDFYGTCVKAGFESPEVAEIDTFLATAIRPLTRSWNAPVAKYEHVSDAPSLDAYVAAVSEEIGYQTDRDVDLDLDD